MTTATKAQERTARERAAAVGRALAGGRVDARYKPHFPSPELLSAAAGLFDAWPAWIGTEGQVPRIEISPGVIAISRQDYARHAKTIERAHATRIKTTNRMADYLLAEGHLPPDPRPSREIVGWSQKSRSNMRKRIGQIDWSQELSPERAPAMVTLTYPGDWLTVAPDGKTSKKHVKKFKKAYYRAWGHKIVAFWKLEFQRRGAPHYHLFMVPPKGKSRHDTVINEHWIADGLPWRTWLSLAWAAAVDCPDIEEYQRHQRAGTGVDYDKGLRGRDPNRIAAYFLKDAARSAKEYQNVVPPEWQKPGKGPGRFWGYWGLFKRVYPVELSHLDAVELSRTMRRWFHAKSASTPRLVPRRPGGSIDTTQCPDGRYEVVGLAGAQLVASAQPLKLRRARRRIHRMTHRGGTGWVAVNDGAAYASQLARYLDIMHAPAPAPRPYAGYLDVPAVKAPAPWPRLPSEDRAPDPAGDIYDRDWYETALSRAPGPVDEPPAAGAGGGMAGMCRSCGEPRRRHSCQAYLASRADRAEHRRRRAELRAVAAALAG